MNLEIYDLLDFKFPNSSDEFISNGATKGCFLKNAI